MKICLLHGGKRPDDGGTAKWLAHAASASGPGVVPPRIAAIDRLPGGVGTLADAYLLAACGDVRAAVAARLLRADGARVGVDLPSLTLCGAADDAAIADWAATMRPATDFLTVATARDAGLAARLWPGVPTFRVPVAMAGVDPDFTVAAVEAAVRRAAAGGRIDLLWVAREAGTGRPAAPDIARLSAWLDAPALDAVRARLTLRLLCAPPDPAVAEALARLPVAVRIEPGDAPAVARAVAESLALVVPGRCAGSAEATARAGLVAGCQLVCAPDDCPEELRGVAIATIAALAAALDGDALPFRGAAARALAIALSGPDDPADGFAAFGTFLTTVPPPASEPAARPPAVAVDADTPPAVRDFLRDIGAIRLGDIAAGDVDIDIDERPDPVAPRLIVDRDGGARLPAVVRDRLRPLAGADAGRQFLPVDGATPADGKGWASAGVADALPGIAPVVADDPALRHAARRRRWARRVAAAPAAGEPRRDPTVAWVVQASEIRYASARYRAFHMAVALGRTGCRHAFHDDPVRLAGALHEVDAVVLVKRLEPAVLELIAAARAARKPVFLDLCDDLLSPRSHRRGHDLNRRVLAVAAPDLAGIVVPSTALAAHMRAHFRDAGLPAPPVFVVGDVAETYPLLDASRRFAAAASDRATRAPAVAQTFAAARTLRPDWRRRIVWFGNFGAAHSNFGIGSLFAALPALNAMAARRPIELSVVSNGREAFDSVMTDARFPVRWVDWDEDSVHYEVHQADVALLTNGDDDFSQLKSANRALLALALGVPVIATASPALARFGEAVVLDDVAAGLERYLGDDGTAAAAAIAAARPILDRYDLPVLGRRWRRILDQGLARAAAPPPPRPPAPLVVLETGRSPPRLAATLDGLAAQGLQPMVTATTTAFRDAELRVTLRDRGILPTLLASDRPIGDDRRWLRGATTLYLEAEGGPVTARLQAWAEAGALPVTLLHPAPAAGDPVPGRLRRLPAAARVDDWLFVAPSGSEGWILDAICREIAARHDGPTSVVYNPRTLPRAGTVFFAHYWNYLDHLARDPGLADARTLAWYTHPRPIPYSVEEQLAGYRRLTRLIFTCSAFERMWQARGLEPARGQVVLGGADPALFAGHARGGGVVGLSSSYYERKNPHLLHAVVAAMPHRRFHLVGRKWHQFERFDAMLALPNFTYQEADYAEYPTIYRDFDVFLSIASLEGGPIPLLEAMMENAVPVASRTGFAPDLIAHGDNGFLFDVDAPAATVAALVDRAFDLAADVRATVRRYSWDGFARTILAIGAASGGWGDG